MCLSSWISKSSTNTTHFEKYLFFYVFMRITATIVANNGYNSGQISATIVANNGYNSGQITATIVGK